MYTRSVQKDCGSLLPEPNMSKDYGLWIIKSKLKLRYIVFTTSCIKLLNVININILCNIEVSHCLRKH